MFVLDLVSLIFLIWDLLFYVWLWNVVSLRQIYYVFHKLNKTFPARRSRSSTQLIHTSSPQIIHFPFIPRLPSPFTPLHLHPHTHSSSLSPHAPLSWSCHLSAPAQSLLRPTAHLPPAPLTAPVANANACTHPHPLRHTQGCTEPHLRWCTYRRAERNTVTHIQVSVFFFLGNLF